MTAITFDTLKYANRLKAANVPSAQAEAEAEALSEVLEVNMKELATKEDMNKLEVRVDSKFDLLRKDIDKLETSLRAMEERTDAKLEKLGLSLTIKLGAIVVIALGAFTALPKWMS